MNTIGALRCAIVIVSDLRGIVRRIVINEYEIVIALTQGIVLLLQICVCKPLLDLIIKILFQLIDVFNALFVPDFRHLAELLNHGSCRIVLDFDLAYLLHLLLRTASGSCSIILAFL